MKHDKTQLSLFLDSDIKLDRKNHKCAPTQRQTFCKNAEDLDSICAYKTLCNGGCRLIDAQISDGTTRFQIDLEKCGPTCLYFLKKRCGK